ncbi:hypothetical protein JOC95_000353 [Bacillus tianshenii]|uniref:Uncharacterized protein n=1 Tax=Sutcliffiella tianshenii TaxID=1463404 RepID=A0ABS2NV20_9BACI|nr:hypothetical protein [Bacillus tianshenii]
MPHIHEQALTRPLLIKSVAVWERKQRTVPLLLLLLYKNRHN